MTTTTATAKMFLPASWVQQVLVKKRVLKDPNGLFIEDLATNHKYGMQMP